jgi:hypothetical protein
MARVPNKSMGDMGSAPFPDFIAERWDDINRRPSDSLGINFKNSLHWIRIVVAKPLPDNGRIWILSTDFT